MKPIIQKLPLTENTTFVARTFRTPRFEVGWHQHTEYELILFTEGSGLSFVGNHVGEFEAGDIYFLGANLPHTFQKSQPDLVTSAVVVQFQEDCWGSEFFQIPESRGIRELFHQSSSGLKVAGSTKTTLQNLIRLLEDSTGFERILILSKCLHLLATSREYITVSTQEVRQLNQKARQCIDQVFQFTIDNFRDPISLKQVAAVACMSVSAFCKYFKRSTKKTYIDFLNEVRVGYACTQLLESAKAVEEICFESGYGTIANFHRQFLRITKQTPLQYRKSYTSRPLQPNH
ncbi:MAG TPA: AraC family transcriptional regulator [Puia sp.]|nr:AraC family transcriptional regulator [Puia sp.]